MSDELPPIEKHSLPISTRAPGKCILFGEHAVVHGAPELVLAVDLDTQVIVRSGAKTRLNGDDDAVGRNPYFRAALERLWRSQNPLEIRAVSRIPRAAGLGSSAAFVAALTAALSAANGGISRATLAQVSFDIEHAAQGVGSPGDTSAAVAGGYVTLNAGDGRPVWTVTKGSQEWIVRQAPDPGWTWIVADSGIPRSTGDAVRAVGARLARPDGPELLERFRAVALDGIRAIAREDRAGTAHAMRANHELLREVGVSHPRLEDLIRSVSECAVAAKLTGAGAGGSIVALPVPGREAECVRRLARAGALAFAVRPSNRGAGLVSGADAGTSR